jgi:hypothetical protein
MTVTTQSPVLIPARAASVDLSADTIDHLMARSILDRLGFSLQDLSLEYGDVVIPSGDISHQLYYGSNYNATTLYGYVWCDNGIYYASNVIGGNHRHPELAALDLLDRATVLDCFYTISLERAMANDYE